jgi:hypothetical protein
MSVLRVPRSSIPASRKSLAGKDKCRKSVDIRNHPAFRIRSLFEACRWRRAARRVDLRGRRRGRALDGSELSPPAEVPRWNAGMPDDSGTGPVFQLIPCDSRALRHAGMPDAGMHEEATTWRA